MIERFIDRDREYLWWAQNNLGGYIVNMDQDRVSPDYPMIHKATHKALTSPKRQNYTTKRFFQGLFE